jgi:hypothetical protein
MAEAVAENGYALPARVPGYTPGGIPFAYPPLGFYLLAPLLDTGVSPLALARVLPGVFTIVALMPTYALGRALLGSNGQAGFAAVIVASSPAVLTWHLSAGGVVRTFTFFLTVCGLYTGYRLFVDSRRWALPTAVLFGLVVLTRPLYSVLFGSGTLYFYLARDRSLRGLAYGTLVALGELILALPWWLTVLFQHGLSVFAGTAGSRLGIGQGLLWFPTNFGYLPATRFFALWHVLVFLGVLYLGVLYFLARRRYFFVGWFAFTALVYSEPRFLPFVGAFLASAFLFEGFLPMLTGSAEGDADTSTNTAADPDAHSGVDTDSDTGGDIGSVIDIQLRGLSNRVSGWSAPERRDRVVVFAMLSVLVLYGATTGTLHAANYEPIPERPLDRLLSEPLPAYVDSADARAMGWARRNTPSRATFLVAGDAAEWFPLLANRRSVASPWGAEWLPPPERSGQIERYRAVVECRTARCLIRVFEAASSDSPSGASPAYLYIPREGSRSWTARSEFSTTQWAELAGELGRSNRYAIAYRNRGALIVRPVVNEGRQPGHTTGE